MPEPDVTENYIRLRQIDPGMFKPGAMKDGADFVTITLDSGKGIRAVYGELKKDGKHAIQSYIFEKDKWTVDRAKAWVEKNKPRHEGSSSARAREVQSRHVRYVMEGGDRDLRVMRAGAGIILACVTSTPTVLAAATIKLNTAAVDHAKALIKAGHVKNDAAWSPSTAQMNRLIGKPPNWKRYGSWHLGINTGAKEGTKDYYRFPFGYGQDVFRRALAAAAQRASQFGYPDIQKSASALIDLIKSEEEVQASSVDDIVIFKRDDMDVVLAESTRDLDGEHVEKDKNGVPTAFRIVEFGKWSLTLPDVPPELIVDETTAQAQMAYFEKKGMPKLPMDYSHKSAGGHDETSPGWWVPEIRDDGIWASQVEWSPTAYAQLKSKTIRHFSPEAKWNTQTGKLIHVEVIALTNRPATNYQLPLVASATKPRGERRMEKLLELLGLKMEATEDEAAKAVEDLMAKAAEADKKDEEIKTLKAAATPDTKELDELKTFKAGVLENLGITEGNIDTVKAEIAKKDLKDTTAELKAMQDEMKVLKAAQEETRVKDLLIKHDKKILPAKRDSIEKLARELTAETFESVMAELPEVKGDPTKPISDSTLSERNTSEVKLTDEEMNRVDEDLLAKGLTRESEEGKKLIASMIASKKTIQAMGY